MAIRFVHALPNSWFPAPGKNLVISGISASDLAAKCKGKEVLSHVRYEDHAGKVAVELGIDLLASGVNAPSPYNCRDLLVVASASPGSAEISYLLVWDGSAALAESGIISH